MTTKGRDRAFVVNSFPLGLIMMGSDADGAFGPKDVVPVDERTGFCEESCTKSAPAGRRKVSRTWCKGNGGTGFCGESCTKSPPAGRRKGTRTWCKGNGGTGLCGESCTNSAPAGRRRAKPCAGRAQKITKSVKSPGASGSVPLLSGLAASQYFLGFDGFKFSGSSYFPELSISSWMSWTLR